MGTPPPPPSNRRDGPAPLPGSERRLGERIELLAQIELLNGDGDIALLPIVNISVGGTLVRVEPANADRDFGIGAQLNVFLDLGESSFALGGRVVRVEIDEAGSPHRVALMWTTTDTTVLQRLAAALQQLRRR